MYTILLVEDSIELFTLINMTLKDVARVVWAPSVESAKQVCASQTFDLILLDVMLPDGDGYLFCESIMALDKFRKTPVIFVTAKTSLEDRLRGFSVGADDFIQKPFAREELKARVETRLQKLALRVNPSNSLKIASLEMNLESLSVTLVKDGYRKELEFGPTEFKLLRLLASNKGALLTREYIYDNVWKGSNTDMRTVDTHISKLRKKLAVSGVAIQSCWGEGYRLVELSNPGVGQTA